MMNAMKKIFKDGKSFYSIVCDYWYGGSGIFRFFKDSTAHVIIDTHNVLSDQRELEINKFQKKFAPKRWIKKYRELESNNLLKAQVLIAISKNDAEYYQSHYPHVKIVLIPSGIDLCKLTNFKLQAEGNTILFYGNLGDEQNIIAFDRLWQKIFPEIKKESPDVQLLVVGSNPTDEMLKLNNLDYVKVTGFVDNPFEFIRKAKIHIIAMETGSGFRGRIPEVMGMGIPTIGTHNALDCVGLEGELQTFVSDDDQEIANAAVRLLKDDEYWNRISGLSKEFISENYSLQKTYKKLENYL
jgi:glycosyltransferase involved in cell wall biosynthesis